MKHGKLFAMLLLALALVLPAFGRQQQSEDKTDGNTGNANPTPEQPRPNEQADAPVRTTLPEGTSISVRIADEVNSSKNHSGDLITGIVDPSVLLADHVVIPRGTEAHMRIVTDRKGGHVHGKADVSLELVSLVINKERLDVDSDAYQKQQGTLSAKVKGTGKASVDGGTSAATSPTPEGGAVSPIIAVFRAAKIDLHAGTRIPFALTAPFTFDRPAEPQAER